VVSKTVHAHRKCNSKREAWTRIIDVTASLTLCRRLETLVPRKKPDNLRPVKENLGVLSPPVERSRSENWVTLYLMTVTILTASLHRQAATRGKHGYCQETILNLRSSACSLVIVARPC
jgi:hypothetical protein